MLASVANTRSVCLTYDVTCASCRLAAEQASHAQP